MFCKECGTKNEEINNKCKSCGVIFKLTNTPLDGSDRIKIIVFFILLSGTIIFGVIPILITLVGIYIMKKDNIFSPILKAQQYIKYYLIILALGATIITSAVYYDDNTGYWHKDDMKKPEYIQKIKTQTGMILVGGFIATPIAVAFLHWLFGALLFKNLERHKDWVIENGIFADTTNEKSIISSAKDIVKNINNQACNVAEELLKWNELKEKGIISEEEFNEAKIKIMNKKA